MSYIFAKLKRFRGLILIGLVLITINSVCNLAMPYILSEIINNGIVRTQDGGVIVDYGYILIAGAIMVGFAIVALFAATYANRCIAKTSTTVGADMRKDLFKKVMNFSMADYNNFSTGTLLTRSSSDVRKIQDAVQMTLKFGFMAPIMAVVALIMALSKSREATKVLLIVMPIFIIAVVVFIKIGYPLFKKIQRRVDRMTVIMRENLTGVRVIRAFTNDEKENLRFDGANHELTRKSMLANKIMSVLMPSVFFIINFTTVAVVYITALNVDNGTYDYTAAGNMIAVMEYVAMVMMSFVMFCIVFINLPFAGASLSRINEVLKVESVIHDNPNGVLPEITDKIDIAFNEVSYTYKGADLATVDNVSFEAHKGQTVAIIGSTGSGKSTLINLLPRFFDLTSGSITINGINIKDIPLSGLRNLIGYVPQKAVLFNETIKDNIAFGNRDATLDEIKNVAKVAQAYDFIMEKEGGFDYKVEERGRNLSGGQKQRLCIARALIRKAPIYIFDDSFSALDFKTDSNLRRAMKPIIADSVSFVVAQRIGSIMNADMILVLDEGKLVGKGTHDELMKSCEVYREIALSQVNEEELKNA